MSDRLHHQLREQLAYLKLGAVAEQLATAPQAAEQDKPSYTQFLHDLLAVEIAATEQRRLDGRLRFASFPAHKTLEQFDFIAQPPLDRRLVDELATLRFAEKANVLLIGPPGVGKTMLATALGLKAVHAGYRVYYTTAAALVARTTRAAIEARWQTTMRLRSHRCWIVPGGVAHRRPCRVFSRVAGHATRGCATHRTRRPWRRSSR